MNSVRSVFEAVSGFAAAYATPAGVSPKSFRGSIPSIPSLSSPGVATPRVASPNAAVENYGSSAEPGFSRPRPPV
jgi:hypothetical protein